MARTSPYKQYSRQQRRALLESDFSHGMMSTNGLVTDGYLKTLVNFTFEKEHNAIIPRPCLRPYQLIMPDMVTFGDESLDPESPIFSDTATIKDVKECVEDGKTYYQTIIGGVFDDDDPDNRRLAVVTSERSDAATILDMGDGYSYDVRFSNSVWDLTSNDNIRFYTTELPEIHHVQLGRDPIRRMEFPVGTFAYGNSYYAFKVADDNSSVDDDSLVDGDPSTGTLVRTVFDTSQIPPRYVFEDVEPKALRVSEAVTYGYNMLSGYNAYLFEDQHTASVFEFEGILPYDPSSDVLMMTPRKNQYVKFRAYYNIDHTIPAKSKYDVVWEWRETTSADWTLVQRTTETFSSSTELTCTFQPPAADMMIRVCVYPYVDDYGQISTVPNATVEKAMVVGFDFTAENFGTASAVQQEVYDLATATGMEHWNGRLVVWGLPKDPTILFLSDYNEPSYFPYPNNIVVFDEPIIYALEFMDSLAVFTTNKLYKVTQSDDGNSWKTEVLQSHLSINAWDKHLVQSVRNMLYFKSGNYYYMMVPKAQSLTGELTLAPITTPITSFFDNFSVNVETILRETYDYTGNYELISYYNFLDYEDIHNIYLYQFDNSSALLHFDVIYNTVDRTWKVWVYESSQPLYPYKPNATESGLLASTSVIQAVNINDETEVHLARIIQLLTWDKLSARGGYIPNDLRLQYDSDQAVITVDDTTIYIPAGLATVTDDAIVFTDAAADAPADDPVIYLLDTDSYYSGFNVKDIIDALTDVYENGENYFTFRNFQFLDSGYRDDELQAKKRYREIQLHVNNLDQKNLQFGMEYILDGAPRKIFYKYDTNQTIDEFDPEYGIVYVDSTPFLEVDLDDIDITNQWTLDQSLYPEISLWKVRIAVSGKGLAPRLKLKSRNDKRFELLGVNWISKLMNMR